MTLWGPQSRGRRSGRAMPTRCSSGAEALRTGTEQSRERSSADPRRRGGGRAPGRASRRAIGARGLDGGESRVRRTERASLDVTDGETRPHDPTCARGGTTCLSGPPRAEMRKDPNTALSLFSRRWPWLPRLGSAIARAISCGWWTCALADLGGARERATRPYMLGVLGFGASPHTIYRALAGEERVISGPGFVLVFGSRMLLLISSIA